MKIPYKSWTNIQIVAAMLAIWFLPGLTIGDRVAESWQVDLIASVLLGGSLYRRAKDYQSRAKESVKPPSQAASDAVEYVLGSNGKVPEAPPVEEQKEVIL